LDKISGNAKMVEKYPIGELEFVLRGNTSCHYIL